MSDEQNETPKPPAKPTAKTSTVPLKKETVRITLRAKPGTGVTQPKADTTPSPTAGSGGSTPPPAAAAAPPAPSAAGSVAPPKPGGAPAPPKPAAAAPKPAVTQPLEQTQKVNPKMQSTQKVTVKAAPAVPVPAKTVPLTAAPATATPGAAAGTQQLPKATVKLQQTQPLTTTPGASDSTVTSGSVGTDSQLLLDEEDRNRGLLPLAVVACIGALAAMALALATSDKVGISLPPAANPSWEKSPDNGSTWSSSFNLDPVPEYDGVDKGMEVVVPESTEEAPAAEATEADVAAEDVSVEADDAEAAPAE